MLRSSLEDARAFFLHARRIAVVGVSRDPHHFSRFVLRELVRRGHDVVPVNPELHEAAGVRACATVQDVDPPPDAAILLVPADHAEQAVHDCLVARVKSIWFHRGSGPGPVSEAALALCRANRIVVVHGLCPMMALPRVSFPHLLHRFCRRVLAHPPHRPGVRL